MAAFETSAPLTTGDVDDDELSPIEQVRLTVANTDDPSIPVWTFRMWFLGIGSCTLLSFLNTFFAYRTEPLVISMISVQVASLPIGQFMERVLPKTRFKLPGFGAREFSLNPGPFNVKEHVLISIFANAGSAFGSGTAYAVGIVDIVKVFYHREISFLAGWILVVTTQGRWGKNHLSMVKNGLQMSNIDDGNVEKKIDKKNKKRKLEVDLMDKFQEDGEKNKRAKHDFEGSEIGNGKDERKDRKKEKKGNVEAIEVEEVPNDTDMIGVEKARKDNGTLDDVEVRDVGCEEKNKKKKDKRIKPNT